MSEGGLWLGTSRETGTQLTLPASALLRHVMALGSSGSGKTVLCKTLVEEAVARGIPVVAVDPQGDICSLALAASDDELREHGADPEAAKRFTDRADVVVFTPASRRGVPLCIDPVSLPSGLDEDERLGAVSRVATTVVSLLGWEADSDDGQGLAAVLDRCLSELLARGVDRPSLEALETHLAASEPDGWPDYVRYLDAKKIRAAAQRLARLDVGARRLLFHDGIPLDVDVLLGRDPRAAPPEGRTRIAVIYLNTLHSAEDKEFLVAALADRLYAWMLKNPSAEPQALFYVDEVAPFVPPVRKPACKAGLSLLFKQARKYGLSCLMATQNPGDVDYKAMAQFGTWALGRLTTRQDRKKIDQVVKSLSPDTAESVLDELARLSPGQFTLLSPDVFETPQALATRRLFTVHETLDDERIAALTAERWTERFAALAGSRAAPDHADTTFSLPLPAERESVPIPLVRRPAAPAPTPVSGRADDTIPDLRLPEAGDTVVDMDVPHSEPPESPPSIPPEELAPADSTHGRALRRADDTVPEMDVDVFAFGTPSAADAVDPELRARERLLASEESMSVRELAASASVSERKARGILKALVSADLAGQYREGRRHRYWAKSTGGRPDLGMPSEVTVVRAAIGREQASRIARSELRGKMLGLLGADETMHELGMVHRLAYKLDFEEKVLKPLLRRLVGEKHDDRLGSVYLHPVSLDVLVFTKRDGLRFESRPAELASDVDDLDGVASFDQVPPASLQLDEEEWRGRRSQKKVVERFQKTWKASPRAVTPIFVPLWRAVLRKGEGESFRALTFDALVGLPTEWP